MNWTLHPVAIAFLTACTVLYFLGIRDVRSSNRTLGAWQAAAFVIGIVLIAVATVSPLTSLRENFLFARAMQQILIGILAPPLLWYGQAVLCIAAPCRALWHRHRFIQKDRTRAVRARLLALTGPGVVWALTLCIFALWHDSTVLSWLNATSWRANAGLWIYFGTYLLFWMHALAISPYGYRPLPVWMRFLYLIVGGEVANMLVGVSLAFRPFVLYDFYATGPVQGFPSPLQDQMISGAIIWVTGSFVYIFMAVALLGQSLFRRPLPNEVPSMDWQRATRRTIAPGLEDRVRH